MFHYADGYRLLESPEEVSEFSITRMEGFILKLQNKIMNLEFKTQNISFSPELTKIQIFKLKKGTQVFQIFLLMSHQEI